MLHLKKTQQLTPPAAYNYFGFRWKLEFRGLVWRIPSFSTTPDDVCMCVYLLNCTCVCVFFFSISLIADGPHYHPACGHKGSSHLSTVHALQLFYRDASSTLLQLVNQWLDFTYNSHVPTLSVTKERTQILLW